MTLRPARLAMLVLAVCCGACGVNSGQPDPLPSPIPSAQPIPHSATPSPTPVPPTAAPTASLTQPAGPREFTESFGAKPLYWAFIEVDNGVTFPPASVQDGFLVFDLLGTNQWGYALYGGQDYADVLVETQVQSRTTGDGAVGLVCRYDEKQGWYEFDMFADGTYQMLFGQWLAAGVARYTPLYQAKSLAVRSDVNTIGLQCQGNILQPFINGAPLRQWPELHVGLQKGEIGLSVSSFTDTPYMAAFDWVRVSEP